MSLAFKACTPSASNNTSLSEKVKTRLVHQIDSLQHLVEHDLLYAAQNGTDAEVKEAFHQSRNAYKTIEWFTEYYAPTASREINGPPLPEIEIEETKVMPPAGFQVIEELVFPALLGENRPELVRETKSLLSSLKRTQRIAEEAEFTPAHLLDACKQEIFRTQILGISGFDTPLSQVGIQETAVALSSVQEVLSFLGENAQLTKLFEKATAFLTASPSFNEFDRLAFITRYANPITREMVRWQQEMNIAPLENSLALSPTATTLFDEKALNSNHFAGSLEAQATPAKIELGKALFFTPVASGGNRTCASCHNPELAFTDGLPKSVALTKGKFVQRNAPTLLYAGLQNAQFYDMRSPTLENQAMDVMANKDEMHTPVETVASQLNQKPETVSAFKKAFPAIETEIKPRHVMIAIASYIRSLAPFSSRFDQYMRGDTTQLNSHEIKGFNLFMGKAKCGTCHFMPLFNGTAGPSFANTEGEVLGVPAQAQAKNPTIDPDLGRYAHNKIEELKFAFKTPTLRNIAKTGPYMHNGAYRTLEEVLDFYNKGGGQGLGLSVENQTLPADPLNLSQDEIKAIVAFLGTLTDKE